VPTVDHDGVRPPLRVGRSHAALDEVDSGKAQFVEGEGGERFSEPANLMLPEVGGFGDDEPVLGGLLVDAIVLLLEFAHLSQHLLQEPEVALLLDGAALHPELLLLVLPPLAEYPHRSDVAPPHVDAAAEQPLLALLLKHVLFGVHNRPLAVAAHQVRLSHQSGAGFADKADLRSGGSDIQSQSNHLNNI
jgi:hypothetical protein